jgi:hypothetical protein
MTNINDVPIARRMLSARPANAGRTVGAGADAPTPRSNSQPGDSGTVGDTFAPYLPFEGVIAGGVQRSALALDGTDPRYC